MTARSTAATAALMLLAATSPAAMAQDAGGFTYGGTIRLAVGGANLPGLP